MSVKQYLAEQQACVVEDVNALRLMGDRLIAAALANETQRVTTMARSIAAYALGIAFRAEHMSAYRIGFAAAIEVPPKPEPIREPNVEQLARRRRQTGKRGMQPFEYLIGSEWLTANEIAERANRSPILIRAALSRGKNPLEPRGPSCN